MVTKYKSLSQCVAEGPAAPEKKEPTVEVPANKSKKDLLIGIGIGVVATGITSYAIMHYTK